MSRFALRPLTRPLGCQIEPVESCGRLTPIAPTSRAAFCKRASNVRKASHVAALARWRPPTLLSFELANICVVKCRRADDQREKLLQAMSLRASFAIDELSVDPAAVAALSLETKLAAYDASYLWLARQFAAELVTLDQALAQAAGT